MHMKVGTMGSKQTKPRIGRPPRTDDPQRVTLLLPGKLRAWLRVQAKRERRDMGGILAEALQLYRVRRRTMTERNR